MALSQQDSQKSASNDLFHITRSFSPQYDFKTAVTI